MYDFRKQASYQPSSAICQTKMKNVMAAFCVCFLIISAFNVVMSEVEVNINVLYKPENCDRSAAAGDYVTLSFEAFHPSDTGNKKFDNTNHGPVHFRLHSEESTAMKGWHQGVDGMCIKEKREVLIPAGELIMGHRLPNTKVPPPEHDIVYIFEVRDIRDTPPTENLFKQIDADEDKEITKDEMNEYLDKTGMGNLEEFKDHKEAVDHMFDNIDKNKDGVISHREFPGPKHDEF